MGFLEHLAELRDRLIKAFLGLAVTTLISMLFANVILAYLTTPVGQDDFHLQTLGPTEGVVIYFRVALLAGGIVSIPWITWQLWMFIAPGLTRGEKRYILLSTLSDWRVVCVVHPHACGFGLPPGLSERHLSGGVDS